MIECAPEIATWFVIGVLLIVSFVLSSKGSSED